MALVRVSLVRSVGGAAVVLILGAILGVLAANTLLQILTTMLVLCAIFYVFWWVRWETHRPNRLRRERLQELVPKMEELARLMDGMPKGPNPIAWFGVSPTNISRALHLMSELRYGLNSMGIGVPDTHYHTFPNKPLYPKTNIWVGMLREITEPARQGDLETVETWTAPLTEAWLENKEFFASLPEEAIGPHVLDERYKGSAY